MNTFKAIWHSRKAVPFLFLTLFIGIAFVFGKVTVDSALEMLMLIWGGYATLTAGEDMAYKLGRAAPDPVSDDPAARPTAMPEAPHD